MSEINKYTNSKIYTVRCLINPDLIYVGSTTQPICKRFAAHKALCKYGKSGSLYKHIIDNDWSNWHIELHEYYPCNNKEELCKREGEVIREIGTINKQIAGRSQKESLKNWCDNNREHYLEKQKEWRENNRDYYLAKNKEWRENNPNYMKEYYARKRSATP
ncbi:hypothetical protein [Cypionkella sp.]|uniref:hypothetical protein n=1 Tax=Cypionkella sp. TaxID=2811411 RepID=UPI0037539A31